MSCVAISPVSGRNRGDEDLRFRGHGSLADGHRLWDRSRQFLVVREPFWLSTILARDSTWSLDGLPVFKNANFLMVDLREDLTLGDY